MKLVGTATLIGCTKETLTLVDWLDSWAKENQYTLLVSSGFRSPEVNTAIGGSSTSGHLRGLCVDFSFEGVNIFKTVTALYNYWLSQVGAWKTATEFEVNRGKGEQWIHVGFIPNKEMVSWTSTVQ